MAQKSRKAGVLVTNSPPTRSPARASRREQARVLALLREPRIHHRARGVAHAAIRFRIGGHQVALAAAVAELVFGERFPEQPELLPAEGKWRGPVRLGPVLTIRAEMREPGLVVHSVEGFAFKTAGMDGSSASREHAPAAATLARN